MRRRTAVDQLRVLPGRALAWGGGNACPALAEHHEERAEGQSTEIGTGYPVGTTFYMEEAGTSFTTTPQFWGAYLVTQIDLGLGMSLWILRASIAAGVSLVQLSDPHYGDLRTCGEKDDALARKSLTLEVCLLQSNRLTAFRRTMSHAFLPECEERECAWICRSGSAR